MEQQSQKEREMAIAWENNKRGFDKGKEYMATRTLEKIDAMLNSLNFAQKIALKPYIEDIREFSEWLNRQIKKPE